MSCCRLWHFQHSGTVYLSAGLNPMPPSFERRTCAAWLGAAPQQRHGSERIKSRWSAWRRQLVRRLLWRRGVLGMRGSLTLIRPFPLSDYPPAITKQIDQRFHHFLGVALLAIQHFVQHVELAQHKGLIGSRLAVNGA